jgi:hypothetical protein
MSNRPMSHKPSLWIVEIGRKGSSIWRPWADHNSFRLKGNAMAAINKHAEDGYAGIWEFRVSKYMRVR